MHMLMSRMPYAVCPELVLMRGRMLAGCPRCTGACSAQGLFMPTVYNAEVMGTRAAR